jgi:sterol desaturase/sphingolipid hydroxylase (fatty acid hydroxylase superfamily)
MPSHLSLSDAFWHVLPNVFAFDGGRYLAGVTLMMTILWIAHRVGLQARIIQNRRAGRADYRREILTSARSVAIYALVATPSVWLQSNGYLVGDRSGHASPLTVAFFVVLLLVAHDAYFYWTHRAMHDPRLFKRWHRTHHRSVTPTPFAAYAFDWREAVVQALFVTLWICLVPTPFIAMFIFLGIMIVRNVMGHSGTELHPRGMADHWFWGLFNTTVHHDLHHSGGFNYNFGLYFTWWDRLMGTEHPRYREVFRDVTTRGRAATSRTTASELARETAG